MLFARLFALIRRGLTIFQLGCKFIVLGAIFAVQGTQVCYGLVHEVHELFNRGLKVKES